MFDGTWEPRFVIGLVAIVGGLITAIVIVSVGCWAGVRARRLREQSRREIAAYVAEGSITAEDGRELLRAGERVVPGGKLT